MLQDQLINEHNHNLRHLPRNLHLTHCLLSFCKKLLIIPHHHRHRLLHHHLLLFLLQVLHLLYLPRLHLHLDRHLHLHLILLDQLLLDLPLHLLHHLILVIHQIIHLLRYSIHSRYCYAAYHLRFDHLHRLPLLHFSFNFDFFY